MQPGGVPIIIGGHTEISAKRAARYGNGFFPATDLETFAKLKKVCEAECEKVGRSPSEIEYSIGTGFANLDLVKKCQDLCVSRMGIAPMGFDIDSIRKGLDDLNDNVLSKI